MSAVTTQTGGRKERFLQRGRKDLKEGSRFFYQALSPFKSYGLLIVFWTTSLFFVLQGVRMLFFCEEVFDQSLGGEASELVDIRASCGQERSSNSAALGSQNVTMGAGNFADQTVST